MQSITKEYLIELIGRLAYETIHIQRESKPAMLSDYNHAKHFATNEEIVDFICTIPFFDERLKDFLLENIPEQTIIISQSWEIEFIKKCIAWSRSHEWLYGKRTLFDPGDKSGSNGFLSLPY